MKEFNRRKTHDRSVWFKDDPVIVSIVERYLCLQNWANLLRSGQAGVFDWHRNKISFFKDPF